jgi:hypothetical protein
MKIGHRISDEKPVEERQLKWRQKEIEVILDKLFARFWTEFVWPTK